MPFYFGKIVFFHEVLPQEIINIYVIICQSPAERLSNGCAKSVELDLDKTVQGEEK